MSVHNFFLIWRTEQNEKIISLLLAAAMVSAVLSGCGSSGESEAAASASAGETDTRETEAVSETEDETASNLPADAYVLPLNEAETLTYYRRHRLRHCEPAGKQRL